MSDHVCPYPVRFPDDYQIPEGGITVLRTESASLRQGHHTYRIKHTGCCGSESTMTHTAIKKRAAANITRCRKCADKDNADAMRGVPVSERKFKGKDKKKKPVEIGFASWPVPPSILSGPRRVF